MRSVDHLSLVQDSVPNLANKTLTVCVVVREPFVIYNEPTGEWNESRISKIKPHEDLENYSGIAIDVTKRLAEIFQFQVRVVLPPDGQFGVQVTGNRWTGLMGTLVRNESDLGVTALSITAKRADYVDFTRAYYVETAGILLRTPEEIQNFLVVFEPFSGSLWLLLLISILLLILVVTIMTKLEDDQRKQQRAARSIRAQCRALVRHRKRSSLLSSNAGLAHLTTRIMSQLVRPPSGALRNSMALEQEIPMGELSMGRAPLGDQTDFSASQFGSTWLDRLYYSIGCVLNILLNKDIKHPPRQTPIRILVCVWWLTTIVIVNFYSGTLFEQLVLPRRPKSVESLEELVAQDSIRWSVTRGSALQELFLNAQTKSIYWQLGQRMLNVSSADEGVQAVIQKNQAFIRERSILSFKLAQEHARLGLCKMQLAKEDFFSVGFGLALRKDSPYLIPFNAALTLMIENGFVARWQSEHWPQKSRFTECGLQAANEARPLSLKHFLSIYLVCGLFTLFAFTILVYQHGKLASMRLLKVVPS